MRWSGTPRISLGPHCKSIHPEARRQRRHGLGFISGSGIRRLDSVGGPQYGSGARNRQPPSLQGNSRHGASQYGYNGWLGIAQIWLSGDHITQGITKLNDSYFNLTTYNRPEWRDMVMCQEIGHTFGLDHQDENFENANLGTCMDYTNNPLGLPDVNTDDNTQPNAHDYDELDTIYSHADSVTTVGSASAAMANNAADWGKAVRFTEDGRGRVFVKDLGAGRQMVTFVTWAPL